CSFGMTLTLVLFLPSLPFGIYLVTTFEGYESHSIELTTFMSVPIYFRLLRVTATGRGSEAIQEHPFPSILDKIGHSSLAFGNCYSGHANRRWRACHHLR